MKQGRSDSRKQTGQKPEPYSKGVNPGGTNNIGRPSSNHTMDGDIEGPLNRTSLLNGRTYQAPQVKSYTTRKGGSQGNY